MTRPLPRGRQAKPREALHPLPRVPAADMSAEGQRVLSAMADLGYPIAAKVEFRHDPTLRIMGYSRPLPKGYRVVAGNGAFEGNLLATLLAHELSHVQRMASGHASHSTKAISAAYDGLRLAGPQEAYHEEILHDVINNVQDLYADVIAFEVMQHMGAVPPEGVGGFFLAWMQREARPGQDARETRWHAAHAMVANARAVTQIKAKGSAAQVRQARRINAHLLAALPPGIAAAQAWFQDYYDTLSPEVEESRFTTSLAGYVQRFVALAEGLRTRGGSP